MKKLIIAASVIAFAVVSQAAALKWSFTGPTGDQSLDKAVVYTIIGATAPTQIDNWDTWLGEQTQAGASKAIAWNKLKSYTNGSLVIENDAVTKANSYYFVMLSADGKQFATTAVMAGNDIVYDTSLQETQKTTALDSKFGAFQNIGNVPEPTSAMLMLIGMAGLALRRRRA